MAHAGAGIIDATPDGKKELVGFTDEVVSNKIALSPKPPSDRSAVTNNWR
jgi:hypothetical protein